MQIRVEKRSKKSTDGTAERASRGPFPLSLELSDDASVQELKAAIAKQAPKLTPERQRLTLDGQALLNDRRSLTDAGLRAGSVVQVKDLGPQVGWRTTFICEYAGPLLANPLFYLFSRTVYGVDFTHSSLQTLALIMFEAHFVKRLYETVFVHKFSNGTMPLLNLVKNTAYYTLLAGVSVGFWVYGPWYGAHDARSVRSPFETYLAVGLFVFAEVSNYVTHANLSNLRPPGTRVRKIPHGYGFDLVSCPNYTFEILAWVAFTYYTRSLAALAFTLAGAGQMYVWAVKKHRNYRREFPDYPKNRKALIPFLL
ncbi:3-oxo-5a-steroid 4- dehydrogenase [Tieghemiomyces parasiticus]|uniref:very-long-chain enoyl-CoA reductase n=1 Tax=Tieghemiomyces parasiticus TaxID=78921 RepID=A0A9W8AIW2_9FUNG|nr:3-oxo-5a-steroid 4- dehydrogenase [Tieghemiomyces parasiticus]